MPPAGLIACVVAVCLLGGTVSAADAPGGGAADAPQAAAEDRPESGAAVPPPVPPDGPMRSVLVPRGEPSSAPPRSAAGVRPASPATDLVTAVLSEPPTARGDAERPSRGPGGTAEGLSQGPRVRESPLRDALESLGPSRPLPIVEALERSGDRSRRGWVVGTYWKASAAVMRLAWSAEVIAHIDTIAPGADPLDRAALDVLAAAAMAEMAAAKASVLEACQELADVCLLSVGEPLPVPADRPLAAPYETHFDAIFAQRLATGRVRAVNRSLPHLHESLESTAGAVAAALTTLGLAEQAHARGERPVEAVGSALDGLARQRDRFLVLLVAYNASIAEYVGAVADLTVDDARFAAMLIGTPLASTWRQPVLVGGDAAPPPQAVQGLAPPSGPPAADPGGQPVVFPGSPP